LDRRQRLADGLRDLASIVGTLPVAVLMCVALARLLPFDEPTRLAVAFTLAIPIWVAAMILTFVARTAPGRSAPSPRRRWARASSADAHAPLSKTKGKRT
jgi:hypothetical protein